MLKKNKDTSAEGLDLAKGVVDMIAQDTTVEGNINSSKGIRIDGTVKGSVTTTGKVVVGKSGVIEGNIVCANADIEGELKSKISVEGLLRLKATAVLLGDIETSKLAIEPGANFSGNCKMGAVVKNLNESSKKMKSSATA